MSVGLTLSSAREVPFGQVNVYLLTGADSPQWQPLPSGWTTTLTVSGFQVFRLPCAVTGVRVMFHTRNSGLGTPVGLLFLSQRDPGLFSVVTREIHGNGVVILGLVLGSVS